MRLDDRAVKAVAERITDEHRAAWAYFDAPVKSALIDAGYGTPHATRDDAIAAAEASIFEGAHDLILALGGWAAVVAAAQLRDGTT